MQGAAGEHEHEHERLQSPAIWQSYQEVDHAFECEVTASSVEFLDEAHGLRQKVAPGNLVDGHPGTRWASGASGASGAAVAAAPQWFHLQLAQARALSCVRVQWECAYASKYDIQVSSDGEEWRTVATETSARAGPRGNYGSKVHLKPVTQKGNSYTNLQEKSVETNGWCTTHLPEGTVTRWVRVLCLERGSQFDFSAFAVQLVGPSSAADNFDSDFAGDAAPLLLRATETVVSLIGTAAFEPLAFYAGIASSSTEDVEEMLRSNGAISPTTAVWQPQATAELLTVLTRLVSATAAADRTAAGAKSDSRRVNSNSNSNGLSITWEWEVEPSNYSQRNQNQNQNNKSTAAKNGSDDKWSDSAWAPFDEDLAADIERAFLAKLPYVDLQIKKGTHTYSEYTVWFRAAYANAKRFAKQWDKEEPLLGGGGQGMRVSLAME